MAINIRDYQAELIAAVRQEMRQHNSVVMQSPTGSGKTLTTAWIVDSVRKKEKRCIFCVHRIELLHQTSKSFTSLGIPHGFIASSEDYDPNQLTHIAGIDTLRRRMDQVVEPDLLVIDEAGHAMSETWQKVINYWPKAKKLLITATPERLDGKGLRHVAQSMVIGKSPRWLIDEGYLSPYRVFAPAAPDLSGVKITGGDYSSAQLAIVMDKSSITGDAVEHYKKHCAGMRSIVFAVNIEHSKHIVQQFNDAGITAAHLDGTFGKIERENVIERFRYGETTILSNVNILTEGFDVPGVQAAILLRPTKSLALYLQMVGRALRPIYADDAVLETKEGRVAAIAEGAKPSAIILDHTGNCKIHGLPGIDRHWSLEGKKGRKKNKEPNNTTCERCYHIWERKPRDAIKCPECGWEPEKKEKDEIEAREGELQEITEEKNPWAWCANKPLSKVLEQVKTRKDLQNIARAKGFKHGWVWYKAKDMNL